MITFFLEVHAICLLLLADANQPAMDFDACLFFFYSPERREEQEEEKEKEAEKEERTEEGWGGAHVSRGDRRSRLAASSLALSTGGREEFAPAKESGHGGAGLGAGEGLGEACRGRHCGILSDLNIQIKY
jgi:hypothetical protein